MASADDPIVTSTPEMPAVPDGYVKPEQKLFPIDPPEQSDLRKMFNEARDLTQEPRKRQQKCRDYFDGPKQLDSDVRNTLKMRGQPAIYSNRVRPAINGILGVMDAAKVDPRAYPRNPDDEEAANVGSKTLRYIADRNNFQQVKMSCAEDYWIEGVCAVIIEGAEDTVPVTQIRWEEFFYDPRSRRYDFKDARYMGFAKWLYADTVRDTYPEAYAAMGDPIAGGIGLEETWQDKPENASQWIDSKNRRILVVTLFYDKGGEWHRCVYCAAGVFDHDVTGYVDRRGRNINPIEAESCYVSRDNERYGPIMDMIPIQDEINARRSRLLHLANSRQIQQATEGAPPVDANTARREAARADGVIPMGWQLVPTVDLASGQQLLLTESKAEIERMGPTPAVLGRQDGSSQSGRARLVLQQAGMTELAAPMGRIEDWETRCYRQMFMRAQQFWTDEMYIRTTDDVNAPEFTKVNEPLRLSECMVLAQEGDPAAAQAIEQAIPADLRQAAEMGVPQAQMMLSQILAQNPVLMVRNGLAEMDLDIIIDTVPDTANLQQEVFAEFIEMVRSGVDPFTPQFELLIEMSPLADKAKVLERLRAKRDEIQQAQAQAAAQQAEIAQAGAVAEIENKNADTAQKIATARKTEAETMRTAIETVAAPEQEPENA